MIYTKNQRIRFIGDQIRSEREYKALSVVFYKWHDQSQEQQTMRILNEEAVGLHTERVLTQIFVRWKQMLPLLKREKFQMKRPELVFNFYRWRKVAAVNNELR